MMVALKTSATKVYLVSFFLLLISSCTSLGSAQTPEDTKARLDCLDPSNELQWEEVERQFGKPDETPIPAPGSLFKNIRIYKDKFVVFHVDKKEIIEAARSKFAEVVIKIEVCKER